MAFFLLLFIVSCSSFKIQRIPRSLRDVNRTLTGPLPPFTGSDEVEVAGVRGNAGMVQVLENGSSMFYWFVEKLEGNILSDSEPMVIWLQGGPGCSSLFGHLYEFGPMYIARDLQPHRRSPTWSSAAHFLFIDNPLGSGFSFSVGNSYVRSQEEMARNLYTMLQELCLRHPQWFLQRDVFIFGESYAGKYIPHIAKMILDRNAGQSGCRIPLRGVGIGNGWVEPIVQTMSTANYSFAAGIIDELEKKEVEKAQSDSVRAFENGYMSQSNSKSVYASDLVVGFAGGLNMYNIRSFHYHDFSAAVSWLNLASTKQLLHVPARVDFVECGTESYFALDDDEMLSVTSLVSDLTSSIRVLIYTGQDDLVCNVLGTNQYLEQIAPFRNGTKSAWVENGKVAGYERTSGNLTQVVVLHAGHMVPVDQPVNSLAMLRRFLKTKSVG